MAPVSHPSGGQSKKSKPASKETRGKPAPNEKPKSALIGTPGKPALKKKPKSASIGTPGKPVPKEKPKSPSKPVASPRNQTSSNCFGNFIFLSDSDRDEQPQALPSRNAECTKSDSDPDSVQIISSPALIGTTATSNSAKRMGNRRGRGSRGRGSRGRGTIHGLSALSLLQNNASANLQHVIGTLNSQMLNSTSLINSRQPGSNVASTSRATPRKTKKSRKKKKQLPAPTESDDPSSSDSNCLLGMSPPKSHKTSHKSAGKGKKPAKEVKKKCNNSKPSATINCGSDSWSCNSSSDDESKKVKASLAKKRQDDAAAAVGGNVAAAKPKVRTNWSDDEDLEDIKVLPEAAIFSNRIESYKEQLKELRKKEWFAKESLMEELTGNKEASTVASKKTKKRKVIEKKKSSTSSDDSEAEIAAKIPVVIPQAASNSDDDECNIKLDETITEEHISKTVRNRIERKMKKMQEEHKEILAIPTSYGCSSDDEDLQCLSDSEVDPEIIVKVRWQHKLVKIPMRSNETFAKVFNEIAKMNDLEVSSIMLLLRDKIVTLDDTPKLLNVTTCDIFDSCILNAREEASDTTVKANYVQIKMQSNDSKVKIPFTIHKLEPMSIVMQEYSTKRNIPLQKMIFEFDGEKIDPNSSPFDLDMEDESCIDVKIS